MRKPVGLIRVATIVWQINTHTKIKQASAHETRIEVKELVYMQYVLI